MLLAALRDMQWRKRRFVIAILSTAIIFGMTLVLTGLANGFRAEAQRTVDSLGVDVFLVKEGASGPFVGATPFAPVDLRRIAGAPGVQAAAPLVYAGGTVTLGDATRNADLFGAPETRPRHADSVGGSATREPRTRWRCRARSSATRARTSKSLRAGCASSASWRIPRHWPTCPTSSSPPRAPSNWCTAANSWSPRSGFEARSTRCRAGYKAIDRDGAIADLLRPLKVAVNSITIVAILLWIVAALIVGSVIYLSALERLRDFAVYKAIGVPTGSIAAGLALQAIVVALSAVVVGVVLSALLGPIFPMQVIVPSYAYIILPVIAVVFGLIASGTGLHRAVSVDPAMAFGGP